MLYDKYVLIKLDKIAKKFKGYRLIFLSLPEGTKFKYFSRLNIM